MFEELIDKCQRVMQGLENGLSACLESIPLLVRQEINTRATRQLDSTKSEYLNALSSGYEGDIYVVELKEEAKLANMLEKGCSEFDLKVGLLKSPKAKMSKQGNKYIHVPMPQNKTGRDATTDKGQALQTKIRAALERPSFAKAKIALRPDGTVSSMEQVISSDPETQGLYRVRKFASMEAYKAGGRPHSTQHVLFRTVSENSKPGSWQHPGLRAQNILGQTQQWCDSVLPEMLASIIDESLKKALTQ